MNYEQINLKEYRIKAGLTLEKLAELTNISRGSIINAERKKLAKNSYIYKKIYDTLQIYL